MLAMAPHPQPVGSNNIENLINVSSDLIDIFPDNGSDSNSAVALNLMVGPQMIKMNLMMAP